MSKVKKKHISAHHVKYGISEQKNHYFGKLKDFCSAAGGPGIFEMIPRRQLEYLFLMRYLPYRFEAAPDEQVPDAVLKQLRTFYPALIKNETISVTRDGPKLPLADYITTGIELLIYTDRLDPREYERAGELKKALEPFTSFREAQETANDRMYTFMDFLGYYVSDLNSCLYQLEYRPSLRKGASNGIENVLLVHSRVPEKTYVTFDGVSRPAIRVCVPSAFYEGIYPILVPLGELGLSGDGSDRRLPLYIQSHALRRLTERLDCISTYILQMYLSLSILEMHSHRAKDGSFKIEYRIRDTKAGYLVAEIVDDKIIIRTFLFITNSGTPEGEKLQQVSALRKLDKQYLAIDKLSTFMNADIRTSKELEGMFIAAGCECLLELHDKVAGFNVKKGSESLLPMLIKYFGVERKHDFFAPDILERWPKKVSWVQPRSAGDV
ncbi:MAG: hypothetical protein M1469_00985 [Bacteroidetes bacterium]|nr:hypothetical protein [Bacteroidota bacterium]